MEKRQVYRWEFTIERIAKSGKDYFDITIGEKPNYKRYVAFKGKELDQYGGVKWVVYDKEEKAKEPEIKPMTDHRLENDLPF